MTLDQGGNTIYARWMDGGVGVCLIRVVKTTVPNRNAEHKLGAGSRTALAGLPHLGGMIEKDVNLH